MTAILEALRALLCGEAITRGRILPSCTAEAFGAEAFGEPAIRELFARNVAPLSPAPHLVVAERHLAVFDADASGHEQALFVDTYDGRISRLWRLGEGSTDRSAEPNLRLAMDPFLHQDREPFAFAAEDFPELDPVAARAVAAALAEPVSEPLGTEEKVDRRVIALRAFSAGPLAAVLGCVLCPRTTTRLVAISLRLEAGACVHRWWVSDAPHAVTVLDDLTTRQQPAQGDS